MPIHTALTRMFDMEYPMVLAPMGGVSGGRLAAAASNAGALGLVGGGYGDEAWLRTELALDTQRSVYAEAVRAGDHDIAVVWAGEAVDLIGRVEPTGVLVRRLGSEAVDQLRAVARLVR